MTRRGVLAGVVLGLLAAHLAHAQGYLTPIVPQPYDAVPPGPSGTGVVGSGQMYVPWNAQQRQTVQRTTVNTDGTGAWSATFNPGFVSSTPTVNVIPLNAGGTVPYICNVLTRSQTTQTGKCWQIASQNVALISLNISLAPASAPGSIPVMIVGAEPTQ